MKKTFYFASIATVLVATLLACNRIEEIEVPVDETTTTNEFRTPETLIFSLSSDENTKSILAEADGKKYGKWETGDKLGSITTKSQGSSTVNADADPVTFAIYSTGGLEVGNTINVWYPYATKQTNPASIPLSIPTEQYQGVSSFDFDAMPMVAETVTVTSEMVSGTESTTPVANIDMLNLGSLLDFKVFSTSGTYSSERVVSINLSTTSAIAGNFTVDLTTVDATDDDSMEISGITETSVTTTLAGPTSIGVDKEHALDVYMVVAPGTYSGTVTVTTDKATYTYALSSKSWARSAMKSFGLDLNSAAGKSNRTPLVKGNYAWVLTEATYSSASASSVVWPHALVSLSNTKGSGTDANNMIPPSNKNDSRFYTGNTMGFDVDGITVEKVLVTTTTDGYASTLAGSTWTNASATASGTTVTVFPDDADNDFSAAVGGQVRVTKVQVFFDDNDYSITNGTITGDGSLSYSATSAKVNTTITITATPGSGKALSSLSVKDSENNDVTVTLNQFRMPASNVTVSATFVDASSPGISMETNAAEDTNTTAGTTATLSGTITLNSGAVIGSVTEAGFYYKAVGAGSYTQVTLDSAPSTTTYTYALTGLTPGTEYTYYSYAVYDSGSEVLGDATEKTFTPLKMFTMTIDNHDSGNNNVHWNSSHTTLTYSGVTWTTSVTWKASEYYGTTKNYASVGSSSNPATNIQLQTSSISGTIKSVSVDCASGSAKHKVTIAVGGNTYSGADNVATPTWSNEASIQPVTGTGSSSGAITITLSGKSSEVKAAYFKKITVLYY